MTDCIASYATVSTKASCATVTQQGQKIKSLWNSYGCADGLAIAARICDSRWYDKHDPQIFKRQQVAAIRVQHNNVTPVLELRKKCLT